MLLGTSIKSIILSKSDSTIMEISIWTEKLSNSSKLCYSIFSKVFLYVGEKSCTEMSMLPMDAIGCGM